MSQKILGWFFKFAKAQSSTCDFVAVACGQSQDMSGAERAKLVETLTNSGWREDSAIRHVTSHSLATSDTIARKTGQ